MSGIRDILNTMLIRKKQLNDLKGLGVYSPEYIQQKRQDYINEVQQAKDKYYSDLAKQQQEKMEKIKGKYINKEPVDYAKKMYEITRITNKVKMMSPDELKSAAMDIDFNNPGYSVEALEIIGAALNETDKAAAQSFNIKLQDAHLEDQWLNDPEYQEAEKAYGHASREEGVNNFLLEDSAGTGQVISIEEELR